MKRVSCQSKKEYMKFTWLILSSASAISSAWLIFARKIIYYPSTQLKTPCISGIEGSWAVCLLA